MGTNRPSSLFFSTEADVESLEGKIENQVYRDRLDAIMEDPGKDASEKLNAILEVGAEWLGVENGHLVQIDPAAGTHTIVESSGEHPAITPGATTDLSNTYCRNVIAQNAALAVTDAPEQGFEGDPAFEAYELSTYFGAKVVVSSQLHGTACFVDREPRPEKGDESDAAALALLVRSIGQVLEQRQKEDRLRDTQARLEAVYEDSPDMICMHDEAGNIILPNPRLCEATGYEAETLVKMKVWDLDPETEPDEASSLWSDMKPGDAHRWESRLQRKDGSTFPVEVDLRRIDLKGEDRFVMISRDVTERKEQEERLRMLSEAIAQANEAVLITEAAPIDEPGPRIVYVNEAFEEMTGYAQEEILGKTPRILQGPKTDRAVLDGLREVLEAGETWDGETINYRKDGTPYRLKWNLAPVQGEDGTIEYWVSTQQDVTEAREREEILRRQKALLEQTQRLAGAWEVDLRTEEMSWSEEVYRIHEVEPGTDVDVEEEIEFYAPDARPKIREAFERCIEEGAPYDLELPIDTAEGNRRWVRTVGAPAEEENGEVVKVAGALQDITARKEAERELERRNDLFRRAEEIAEVGAWEYDVQAGELTVTDQTYRVHGLSPGDEMTPGRSHELFHPDDRSEAQEAFRRAVEEGKSYDLEARLRTDEGEKRWVRTRGKPQRGDDGDIVRVRGAIQDITEQKKNRESLRRSEERLQMAIEGGNIGTWDWDLETGRVVFNRQWAEMLGYSREELDFHFSTWENLIHPDDLERAMSVLDRYIEGKVETYDPEIRMRTESGDWKWIQAIGKVIDRDDDGEVTRAAGIHLDIDERKRAEEAVRRNARRFQALFEDPNILVGLIGTDGTVLDINQTAMRYVEPDLEQIKGKPFWETPWFEGDAALQDDVKEWIRKARDGKYVEREADLTDALGEETVMEGVFRPVLDEEGQVTSLLISDRDVTERKEAEWELRETKKFYEQVFDQIPIDLAVFDRQGRFVHVNAESVSDSERREQILGKTNEEYFRERGLDPEIGRRRDEAIQEALETGEPNQIEETLETDEGPVHYLRVQGPVTDSEGEITHVAGYGVDLTDRKEAERKLREAKTTAEEAAQLRTIMLANMSHEVRTPLTSMIGFSGILEDQLDGQPATLARRIRKSGERLETTVEAALRLSKLEAGSYDIRRETVRLDLVAEEVVQEFAVQAQERGIEVELEMPDDSVDAHADDVAVRQIISNLLDNAIKFTPEEGRVTIRTYVETSDAAILEVEDTGIGIAKEALSSIFEAFKQESEGLARKYEGVGLGLSIVRNLVEVLGGEIDVETEKGEGSRFVVQLPRAPGPETNEW